MGGGGKEKTSETSSMNEGMQRVGVTDEDVRDRADHLSV